MRSKPSESGTVTLRGSAGYGCIRVVPELLDRIAGCTLSAKSGR
ncbi:hypothetical protein ACFQZE_09845 [Paenibacillus sp. GCM10027627]